MYCAAFVALLVFGTVVYDVVTSPSFSYHSHFDLFVALKSLHSACPNITRLSQIGTSGRGLALTVLEISDRPGHHEVLEPEFKFIGNIHGNEPVGKELLLHFAYLVCMSYGKDEAITTMVDSTRLHLLFSMNPDGFATAQEGVCYGSTGRYNAANVDLHRNFPDPFDTRRFAALQPETKAVMAWLRGLPFVLSASFHGGAMVASYPYDNLPHSLRPPGDRHPYYTGIYSPTPDDDVFRHLATTYARRHRVMHRGDACATETFEGGVTNGAHWYTLRGGMQDFNYVNTNCFEITLEVSCCKYPNASLLKEFWTDNKAAMFAYVDQVHMGVKGLVREAFSRRPVANALIAVAGRDKLVAVTGQGEFWRLLLPGNYTLTASAHGYANQSKTVIVTGKNTTLANFELSPLSSVGPSCHREHSLLNSLVLVAIAIAASVS